jgi:hypothetical protein
MGGFWPRIYVVKKGHARDVYFLLQTRNFWYFSAPSSLFTCCYLLASAFHRLCLLSHIKLRSGRSADLRSLRWYSIERLAGVAVRPMAFAPEMEELVRRGSDWRTVGSREANTQEAPLPDRPPKSYAPPWRV